MRRFPYIKLIVRAESSLRCGLVAAPQIAAGTQAREEILRRGARAAGDAIDAGGGEVAEVRNGRRALREHAGGRPVHDADERRPEARVELEGLLLS